MGLADPSTKPENAKEGQEHKPWQQKQNQWLPPPNRPVHFDPEKVLTPPVAPLSPAPPPPLPSSPPTPFTPQQPQPDDELGQGTENQGDDVHQVPDHVENHEPSLYEVDDCPVERTHANDEKSKANMHSKNDTVKSGCQRLPQDGKSQGTYKTGAPELSRGFDWTSDRSAEASPTEPDGETQPESTSKVTAGSMALQDRNDGNGNDTGWTDMALSYVENPAFLVPATVATCLLTVVLVLLCVLVWQWQKRNRARAREAGARQFLTASELAVSSLVGSSDRFGTTSPGSGATATILAYSHEASSQDVCYQQRTPRVYSYKQPQKPSTSVGSSERSQEDIGLPAG